MVRLGAHKWNLIKSGTGRPLRITPELYWVAGGGRPKPGLQLFS